MSRLESDTMKPHFLHTQSLCATDCVRWTRPQPPGGRVLVLFPPALPPALFLSLSDG